MLPMILCNGFSSLAALLIAVKVRRDKASSWFWRLTFLGFAWLTYEIWEARVAEVFVGLLIINGAILASLLEVYRRQR